jgi:hypothetical protein
MTRPVPLRGIFTICLGLRPGSNEITHPLTHPVTHPVTHIPPYPPIEILTGSERRLDEF